MLMLLTCVTVGFTGMTVVSDAACSNDVKLAATNMADLSLIVPEQIYAAPDGLSFKNTVHTPFQMFINTNEDGTITAEAEPDDHGEFYFKYQYAANAKLSVKAFSDPDQFGNDASAFTSGYVTIGGVNYGANDELDISNDEHLTFGGMTINIAKATDGYYLLWKVTYNDTADNNRLKAAYAVTYVYKPYVIPIAAGAAGYSGASNKMWGGSSTFMTGFHSLGTMQEMYTGAGLTHSGSDYNNFSKDGHTDTGTLRYNGEYGWNAFITDKTMYVNSVATSANPGYVFPSSNYLMINEDKYGAVRTAKTDFSVPNESETAKFTRYQYNGIPLAYQKDFTPNGSAGMHIVQDKNFGWFCAGDGTRFTDPHNNDSFPLNARFTQKNDNTIGNNDDMPVINETCPAAGVIAIDTSRYTKLEQVPNLRVGFAVNTDTSTDNNSAHWYIADVSHQVKAEYSTNVGGTYVTVGTAGDDNGRFVDFEHTNWCENPILRWSYSGSEANEFKAYTRQYWSFTELIAGQTNGSAKQQSYNETEGVRYAGRWFTLETLKSLSSQSSTQKYNVKGFYDVHKGTNYACTSSVCQLQAYQVNKSALRTQVLRATKAMAKLGVTGIENGMIESRHFMPDSNYKWDTFQSAYKTAVKLLTKLDLTAAEASQVATAATNLRNALNNLSTAVYFANGLHGTISHATMYVTVGIDGTATVDSTSLQNDVTPARGYHFGGFSTNRLDTAPATTLTVGYNNTIYPICLPDVTTVALEPENDGIGHRGLESFEATVDAKPLNITDRPTREGSTFNGYYTQPNSGGTRMFNERGEFIPQSWTAENSENVTTLYAGWVKEQCTVTFEDLDGNFYGTQTVGYGDYATDIRGTVSRTPNDRYHYRFKEYQTVDGQISDLKITDRDTTIYIIWTQEAHSNWTKNTFQSIDATCGHPGELVETCAICGYERHTDVPQNETHESPLPAVIENDYHGVETCEHDGGYDEVIYCGTCGQEISREHVKVGNVLPHDWEKRATDEYLLCEASCVRAKTYYTSCSMCGKSSKGTADEATFTVGEKTAHKFVKVLCDKSFNDANFECYLCTVCGFAYTSNGLEMQVTNGKVSITKYDGNENKVYIPQHVNGYPIVKIEPNVYLDYPDIEHVFFGGTEAEWNAINFTYGNDNLFGKKMHYAGGSGSFSEDSYKGCPYCGKIHPTTFVGKLTQFFHVILNFFRKLGTALTPHK